MSLKKQKHLKPVKACFAFLEIQAKVKDKTIKYSVLFIAFQNVSAIDKHD